MQRQGDVFAIDGRRRARRPSAPASTSVTAPGSIDRGRHLTLDLVSGYVDAVPRQGGRRRGGLSMRSVIAVPRRQTRAGGLYAASASRHFGGAHGGIPPEKQRCSRPRKSAATRSSIQKAGTLPRQMTYRAGCGPPSDREDQAITPDGYRPLADWLVTRGPAMEYILLGGPPYKDTTNDEETTAPRFSPGGLGALRA